MKQKIEYKVLHEHSEDCHIIGTKRLYYVLDGEYYGNRAGKRIEGQSNWVLWYRIVCNDPQCEYQGIISDNLISELIIGLDVTEDN